MAGGYVRREGERDGAHGEARGVDRPGAGGGRQHARGMEDEI